ncbi:BZIP family transcriptional factor [Mycena sanguinolenta]|uniref:BZIP family transcriptional factor n=1 Tax=Mycena sanguinolenta TaxID=230812 RepID=A0A8H6YZ32_9AGAR|nr:BZIP family transcriptional factor [Mycena sanguinolenta]
MDTYTSDISPLWDLSQASSFSQLPDDDFLALLQKQFPNTQGPYSTDFGTMGMNGVNPQTISRYPLPTLTPPSEDSSPSPPQQSGNKSPDDEHDLKRKASDEDFEEGPSTKAQHTLSNGKKAPSRRKASGGGNANNGDESRLMKRKEQNRAAQRAFRERKEKHVKDLEDKVAALEAKNDAATSENENLRDLLSRLQNENVMLKESSFTFAVPKAGVSGSVYSTIRSPATSASTSSPQPPNGANPLDYSSLTTFDPAMLSLLDDTPQHTATDGAMQMNFGFGESSSVPAKSYTTIASNPMFTSFASAFDSQPSLSPPAPGPAESSSTPSTNASPFNFDMGSLSAWSTPNPDNGAFDDLFGGFMGGNPIDFNDFNVLMANSPSSSISPVAHHASLNTTAARSPANSTTSSSSKSSDPLFNTPRESSSSDFDDDMENKECPKSREEARKRITNSGPSAFTEEAPAVRKAQSMFGPTIMCEGSAFPQTQQSEKNMEILAAWRTVTSDPLFKDSDLAELCSEFSSKARCDGTKVVLEPQGVRHIIESLGQKHRK